MNVPRRRRPAGAIAVLCSGWLWTAPPVPAQSPPSGGWQMVGQIGGPTQGVAVQGNYAYVGVGLRLVVLDISNPAALREVGLTAPFPHFVSDVAVSGTRAYVAAGGSGLRVVDVSNPTKPTEIGAWDSPGYAEGVAVAGNTVYLADGPYGLRVVDVSNAAQPREIGSAYPVNYAFKVAVEGRYAYIAAAGAGLLVADVSNPARPVEVATLDTPGYAYGVAVSGDTIYVADGWEGVKLVNVSSPARPVQVRAFKTPGWAFGATVAGRLLYVADAFKGLRVLDSSTLAELGGFEVSGGHAGSVAVAGNFAYVADRNSGLHAVNVSDPARATRVGFYAPLGYADAVAVSGNYAYVAAGTYGLRVVDISEPERPRQVGIYDTQSYANTVAVDGHHAYVATVTPPSIAAGLHVVDVRDPARPAGVGFLRQRDTGASQTVAVAAGIAYVANEEGLQVVDVSNPANPKELSYLSLCDSVNCGVYDVAVRDGLAYLACQLAGLKVMDVSDPANPRLVGERETGPKVSIVALALAGQMVYAVGGPYLAWIDVSDRGNPILLGSLWKPGESFGVVKTGNEVLVAGGGAGLYGIDASMPAAPTLASRKNTAGYAWHVAVQGDHVYVADGDGGLLILRRTIAAGGDYGGAIASRVSVESGLVPDARVMISVPLPREAPPVPEERVGSAHRRDSSPVAFTSNTALVPGTCIVTSPADAGAATLRWCLENATGGSTVVFDPAAFPASRPAAIALSRPLPRLERGRITIDASTAGVVLDGSGAPPQTHGLWIVSEGNVIKGLQILRFPGDGVRIEAPGRNNVIGGDRNRGSGPLGEGNLISANGEDGIFISGEGVDNNVVLGNFIGTTIDGRGKTGNRRIGVFVRGGARGNRIGGLAKGERNIISGNGDAGVRFHGATTSGNVVVGNYVGTDVSGTLPLGNKVGVDLTAPRNRVGGRSPEERNLISANGKDGVGLLSFDASGNTVAGNYIGVDASGSKVLSNTLCGVAMEMGANNNLIENNLIVSTNRGAVIMSDWGTSYNTVIGNLIGVDVTGTTALGSDPARQSEGWGVLLGSHTEFNRIGGTTPEERNIIAGSVYCGKARRGNLLLGNFIGTDISGIRAVQTESAAVRVSAGCQRLFIGGSTEGERNVISGGPGVGIAIGPLADYAFVAGNYIGTDATGALPLANRADGISIESSEHSLVQRNTIAFNGGNGITVQGLGSNTIRQNSIHSHPGRGVVLADGGNDMLAAPVVMAVTATAVSGTACAGCTVEIFSDTEDEGRVFEGSVVAGASGGFTFEKGGILAGPNITATATDRAGNTSELSGCGFGVSGPSERFPAAGGTGSVNVAGSPFCSWRATSGVPWITITSGAAGTGSGTVSFTVSPNTAPDGRAGTLTIAGQSFTVRQSGGAPNQPSLAQNGVVNGASFLPGLASATWITIYGINLAPTTRTWSESDFAGNRLPTRLDDVRVNIKGTAAYVAYISPTQINALAPDDPDEGPVAVQVVSSQGSSNTVNVPKSRLAPAFFMFDPEARKYVAAVHPDGTYVGKPGLLPGLDSRPAAPGDIVQLYGTGFGPTNPARPTGQIVARPAPLTTFVSVRIGDAPAEVLYAGLVASGLYQFNVRVPEVPDGDQPVVAEIDGFRTQPGAYVTIGR